MSPYQRFAQSVSAQHVSMRERCLTNSSMALFVRTSHSRFGILSSRSGAIRLLTQTHGTSHHATPRHPHFPHTPSFHLPTPSLPHHTRLLLIISIFSRLNRGNPSTLRMSLSDKSKVSNWSCQRKGRGRVGGGGAAYRTQQAPTAQTKHTNCSAE